MFFIEANDRERITHTLDRLQPDWAICWADQSDLQALARGDIKVKELKYRTGTRLFPAILMAAVEARLVQAIKEPNDV